MTETITGKVAAIIDDTTLVLNVGRRAGVREGQVFAVVAAHQEIRDPDTGESLGRWESVKGRVVVTHVQERLATARSPRFEADRESTETLSAMMVRDSFGLYGTRGGEPERASLPVRSGAAAGRPRPQPIEVGDTVHLVRVQKPSGAAPAAANPTAPDLPSQSYAPTAAPEPQAGEAPVSGRVSPPG